MSALDDERRGARQQRARRAAALGRKGEEYAAHFYTQRGYRVLDRNVTYSCGEVDLILRAPDGTCVFVEVKTRSTSAFGVAEAVGPWKLVKVRRAAARWLREHPQPEVSYEVVAVIASQSGHWSVDRWEDVTDGAR